MVERGVARSSVDDRPPVAAALACLALVGRMSGLPLSPERLRADHDLPPGEVGLDTLALCAERAGFRCKVVTLDWRDLAGMRRALPAIVRLRDGRIVVLTRFDHGGEAPQATLLDPAGEPLVLLRAAFERAWSGEILLLKRSVAIAEQDTALGWTMIGDLLRAEPRLLRDFALSTAVLGLLAVGQVLLARTLVQQVSTPEAAATVLFLGCGVVLLILFEGAFTAVRQSLVTRLSVRVGLKLDTLAFDRLLRLPLSLFETTPRARFSTAMARVGAVQASLAGAGARTALDGAVVLILLPTLMATSLLLTGAVVAVAGLVGLLAMLLARRQRHAATALATVEGEGDILLDETLGSFRTVKSAGLGNRQRRRWDVLTARVTRLRFAEADAVRSLDLLGHGAERLLVFGAFTLGVVLTVTGVHVMAPVDLFAGLLITWRMAAPLRALPDHVRAWNAARDNLSRLATLVDAAPEHRSGRPGVSTAMTGHIAFTGVQFSYPDAPGPTLQSVTFEAPAGTMLGVMGRSGAGKSTIVRLLQRMGGDYQGLIKIDGIDLREFDLDHLRANLAVVAQDSPLFPGTLRENLDLGRPGLSAEALLQAIRLVGAEEMIERLPQGLDTVLTETGALLSDGQRQRLAIARALLTDPAILVLDEATAALDAGSEAQIIAALRRRGSGRTLVVVAQRLAALAAADAIVVLDRGEIQDIGRHQDLVERSDLYSGLWRRQSLAPGPIPGPRLTRGSHVA